MQDVRNIQFFFVFFFEFLQRRIGIALAGFHFYRGHIVSVGGPSLRDEKIDLHPLPAVISRRVGIKIEFVAGRSQHLRDDVLEDHPFIDIQFAQQQLLIDILRDEPVLIEGQTDQQSGIPHIELQSVPVPVQADAHIGRRRIVADIADHRIFQPQKGAFVISKPAPASEGCQGELLFVLGELFGYLVKEGAHFSLVASCMFGDILPIELQDVSLHQVRLFEALRLQVGVDRLGHPAYDDVLSEEGHRLSVERLPQGLPFLEIIPDNAEQRRFIQRPQEFFEVHGIEFEMSATFSWMDSSEPVSR